MPIKEGNWRLQVSFPMDLKEEIAKEAQENSTSFQKMLIKICQDYFTNKNKSTCADDYDQKVITTSLIQEEQLSKAIKMINNMDKNQKLLIKYTRQLNTIMGLLLSTDKEDD